MTPMPVVHTAPPSRMLAGITSLAFGVLAAIPLGLFLGAEVGLADTSSVEANLAWGTAVVTLGAVAVYGGVPAALLAIFLGLVALVRNARVGKGCGLAGLLLGGVVLVWVALAVLPQLGGPDFG